MLNLAPIPAVIELPNLYKAFKHDYAQDKNARHSCQGDAYEGDMINTTHA
jgi:hypothetical protein